MTNVFKFALQLSLKVSQCEAGCLLKKSDSGTDLIAEEYAEGISADNTINLILPFVEIENNSVKFLHNEKLNTKFPKIVYCDKIFSDLQDGYDLYFILISLSQLNVKAQAKKIIETVADLAGNNYRTRFHQINPEYVEAKTVSEDNPFIKLSDDFFFVLSSEGKFIELNPAGEIILGYTQNVLSGKHFNELVPVYELNKVSKYFNRLIRSEESLPIPVTLLSNTGEEVKLELRCSIVKNDSSELKIFGIAKINKEVRAIHELNSLKQKLNETERILKIERSRVNQQKVILEELNRMKNEFISNISHEFRTPLASIIGFSETIDTESDISEEMKKEFNSEILNEAKRLAKLINEVLDTTSVAGRQLSLNKSMFDLCKLIAGILEKYNQIIAEKRIVMSTKFFQDEVIIFADITKISRVIDSLLDISISSGSVEGRIYISVSDFGEEVELQLIDSGQVLSESELQQVFSNQYSIPKEKFTLHPFHSLVFAKQIVDLHGGLFIIESEINKGTSFVIKLPGIKNRQHS